MKNMLTRRLRSLSLIIPLVCAWVPGSPAEPVLVRHVSGTVHGFLEMRAEDGHLLASGDVVQVAHGDQVTLHTVFNFKDGSVDDETTVFTQHHSFHLITYHHIQKGPYFPHPVDISIDSRSRQFTVRSPGKDGKEEVKTDHVDMPLDLANGIVGLILANVRSDSPETDVSMLVATPKPRQVKLAISSRGEEAFTVAGSPRKAIHYEIKIEIGGIAGMVAPLVGKQPPNIQVWVIGGEAPTFVKEEGPIYQDGPVMTIQLASPVWPDPAKAGK